MRNWKSEYKILKENIDGIVKEKVKEGNTSFANHIASELQRYGIEIKFEESETKTTSCECDLEIASIDYRAFEEPYMDKIMTLYRQLEDTKKEHFWASMQVAEPEEKLKRIENTQPESETNLIIPGTAIDVARMIIQGKTINGEQYNIYGIKEIAEYLMVHCKNYNIEA